MQFFKVVFFCCSKTVPHFVIWQSNCSRCIPHFLVTDVISHCKFLESFKVNMVSRKVKYFSQTFIQEPAVYVIRKNMPFSLLSVTGFCSMLVRATNIYFSFRAANRLHTNLLSILCFSLLFFDKE